MIITLNNKNIAIILLEPYDKYVQFFTGSKSVKVVLYTDF